MVRIKRVKKRMETINCSLFVLRISYVVAKLQNKRIDFQYVKINPFMYIKFVYHAKSLVGNVHFHYNCRAHNLFPLIL